MLTVEQSAISLGAVVLLLAANAFFVAAEFALVKVRGFRVDAMARESGYSARLTAKIHGNLEAYLAACQLGITMASLGLGWVGEPAVAALLRPLLEPFQLGETTLHTISFLLGFTIFSSLHIVVGEQVPKTFAIRKPEPVSIWCAIPLRLFFLLCFPLNWVLNWSSRAILRLCGVDEAPHVEVLTNSEIRGVVDASAEHGELAEDKALMINNLFRFDERAVARVMIPRVECEILRLDQSPEAVIDVIRETRHSRFPVIDPATDGLVGIILTKDLLDALLAGTAAPWADLRAHCRDTMVVPETLKVSRLFDAMRSQKAHMACIVDEYGAFVGLVTLEDLLEEIVGEISDETDDDQVEFPIVPTESGWNAHGFASLADVEREIGFAVDDNFHANTLSGLFMNRLERLPRVGDQIDDGAYKFTVTAVKDRHVELVSIEVDRTMAKPGNRSETDG